MINRWFIDDIDIYDAYKVGIVKDGFSDLFLFPSLKTPLIEDWHERDGIEVDLSSPFLNNKEVGLSFASVTEDNFLIDEFVQFLGGEGYRQLDIRSLDKLFQLRVSQENNRNVYRNGQTFTLQFIDDFPRGLLDSEAVRQGHRFNLPKSDYLLDGVRFDEYGIIVEKGKAEVYKMPALKKNLERNIGNLDSVLYDTGFVGYQSKDVTLKCALYCDTMANFWQNYYSFFGDLIKANLRYLTVEYAEDVYACFYKQTSNPYFYKGSNYVLLKFDLTLTFTDFVPKKTYIVWGSQDGKIIITQDEINVIKYEG